MNPLDRGIAIIYALAGILSASLYAAVLSGWKWPSQLYQVLIEEPGFLETAYALAAILILAGIRILWLGLHSEKKHAVVQEGSLGQIRIALGAIESLVEKVALDQRGVKEAKAIVESTPRGIGIRIKSTVAPDVAIPHLSEEMQRIVSERVLQVTGIEVRDIRIVIQNISAQKLRVE
ncbi:MAG: alkaline shock response membrane anchor protein AmaP [Bacillota bacterium]